MLTTSQAKNLTNTFSLSLPRTWSRHDHYYYFKNMQIDPQREICPRSPAQLARGQAGVAAGASDSLASIPNSYSMRLLCSLSPFYGYKSYCTSHNSFSSHKPTFHPDSGFLRRHFTYCLSAIPCTSYPSADPMKNHWVGNPDFEGKNRLSRRSGPCVSQESSQCVLCVGRG